MISLKDSRVSKPLAAIGRKAERAFAAGDSTELRKLEALARRAARKAQDAVIHAERAARFTPSESADAAHRAAVDALEAAREVAAVISAALADV